MSLSNLASLGSFVSGFAVLISLIYLALQVRQTERNQQISIRHSRVSRTVELHVALADPAVADAWLHGTRSPQEISETELSQFTNLCRAHFFHFEDSFYQREEGLLNDAAFETVVAGARLLARSPGVLVKAPAMWWPSAVTMLPVRVARSMMARGDWRRA